MHRLLITAAVLALVTAAAPAAHASGPGKAGKPTSGASKAVTSAVLSPATATIPDNGTQAYAAEGFDAFGNDRGEVTNDVTFTVGDRPCDGSVCWGDVSLLGNNTVSATDSDGHVLGTATLTVVPGPAAYLVQTGGDTALNAGQSTTFSVDGYDAEGAYLGDVTGVTSFIPDAGASCIGSTCTFTLAGDHTISAQDGAATQSMSVTVYPGQLGSIVVTPSNAYIQAGGSVVYSVEAYDEYGNDLGDGTAYSTFDMDAGSCDLNTCTSTTIGAHTVTVHFLSATATATLNVTIGTLYRLALTPGSATIDTGRRQSYKAIGYDAYNNSYGNLTAQTAFTISPDGTCRANRCGSDVAGPHVVTGSIGSAYGSATLQINPPARP